MIKVIDWLNFWIGVVFAFAGVSFLISAIKHNTPFYFSNYLLFVIVGTLFFVGGIRLMIEARVEFDSTLHECTEWECTQGDFLIQDNQNGNWHCSFYDEGIYDTGLRVSHITGEEEPISKCVSFRAKTECELGNENYVLTLDSKITCLDENCSSYVAESNYIPTCREKTECEKGNPEYTDKVFIPKKFRNASSGTPVFVEIGCRKKTIEQLEVAKIPTVCVRAEPKVEVRDVGDFGVLSEEWNLSDTSNDYVREDWGAEISGELGFNVFDFRYKVYTGSVQSLLDVLISVEKKDSFYIVSNESFPESFDWDTSILQSGNYNHSLKDYDVSNVYIEGEPYEDCTETYDECSIIGNTSRYKCITKKDSSGCKPQLWDFTLYYQKKVEE